MKEMGEFFLVNGGNCPCHPLDSLLVRMGSRQPLKPLLFLHLTLTKPTAPMGVRLSKSLGGLVLKMPRWGIWIETLRCCTTIWSSFDAQLNVIEGKSLLPEKPAEACLMAI